MTECQRNSKFRGDCRWDDATIVQNQDKRAAKQPATLAEYSTEGANNQTGMRFKETGRRRESRRPVVRGKGYYSLTWASNNWASCS